MGPPITSAHAVSKVIAFHHRIGAPIENQATMPKCNSELFRQFADRLKELGTEMQEAAMQEFASGENYDCLLRAAMSMEEFAEWMKALGDQSLLEAADAWGDRMFLLMGDAVAMGLPANEIFHEVSRSNFTKTPKVVNGFGKAVKGPNYDPPNMSRILANQRDRLQSEDSAGEES